MRFTSVTRQVLDDSGRLTIPAKARRWFSKEAFVTPSRDGKCLYLYNEELWDIVAKRASELPATDDVATAVKLRVGAMTEECHVDAQGRVLIPEELRRLAGIQKEVVLAGAIDKLTLWNPERWAEARARIFEDPDIDDYMREKNVVL
jgi:MraZ protein